MMTTSGSVQPTTQMCMAKEIIGETTQVHGRNWAEVMELQCPRIVN